MSQIEADALTAEVVAEYLGDNLDFFQHRRDLVDRLALPYQEQGAVSLVHVQMNRQRQRIEDLEEEITGLMSLAKNNDQTFHRFMQLQEKLLKADSLLSAIKSIEEMAKSLDLQAYVGLFECESSYYQLNQDNYQRFATNHLNGKNAYLGRLRKTDRDLLLRDNQLGSEMGSYVVLPLCKKSLQGVLVFASCDGGHFQPHMDTLFLRHLALVLSHLIDSLPWQSDDYERITSTTA